MAKRTDGKSKLTPEVRQRLVEVAAEARRLVSGEKGHPLWGTKFVEIENCLFQQRPRRLGMSSFGC